MVEGSKLTHKTVEYHYKTRGVERQRESWVLGVKRVAAGRHGGTSLEGMIVT